MKRQLSKLTLAAAATFALAGLPAHASGIIDVINEGPQAVHPWFKSNCWGFAVPQSDDWVFFGGIGGGGGRFGWDFSDPALTDPGCPHPAVEFTYTTDLNAPVNPPGNHRVKMLFSPDSNYAVQIGKSLYAKELEGPGETGR